MGSTRRRLAPRHRRVADLVNAGRSTAEIASELGQTLRHEASGPSAGVTSTAQSTSIVRAPRPVQVALARAPVPLILWLGMRLFVAEIALVVAVHTPGTIGAAVMVVALIVLAYAVFLAIHVLSLRLFVSPAAIEVRSLIWRRRYRRAGAPRRYPVPPGRGAFGTTLGALGIELGRGRMPSGEVVEVIRLAPLDSIVLVPCEGILLAIAPSSERALRQALPRKKIGFDPE